MTPVFRLFDVIWCWKMWKYPLVDMLTDKSLSSWQRDEIGWIKNSNCFQLSSNYFVNVIRLNKCHSSDVKRKMFFDSKCRDTSCHVQTLIWELLNGADQVVLYESIGVCAITVEVWELLSRSIQVLFPCLESRKCNCARWNFCSNLFEKLSPIRTTLQNNHFTAELLYGIWGEHDFN